MACAVILMMLESARTGLVSIQMYPVTPTRVPTSMRPEAVSSAPPISATGVHRPLKSSISGTKRDHT